MDILVGRYQPITDVSVPVYMLADVLQNEDLSYDQWCIQNIFIGVGKAKILGRHTKLVILVATEIQFVGVYCMPLNSFFLLKRQYASNTYVSSLRNTQIFQKKHKCYK